MTHASRTRRPLVQAGPHAVALALAAVACAGTGARSASATITTAASPACRSQLNVARVLRRTRIASTRATKIVVARVALSRDGLVRRIAIHPTGDPTFDATALRAIAETAFAPAARACTAIDSDFEYVLVARPNGIFASAILPTHGDFLASH